MRSPDAPWDAAVEALRHRRDWRDFRLVPCLLLVVPGNDGDSALFAAPSAAALAVALDRVEGALRAAGFPVSG